MKYFNLLTACLIGYSITAQNIFEGQENASRISATEFGIPSSPVFDLMGVTPSQVVRTSDIKDFKVDWSFKSWNLSPNLSLQTQPWWELFYNRKPLSKYQNASKFSRLLTTLDLSAGSVLNEEGNRRIGFAAKMGLFRERDPLLENNIYDDIEIGLNLKKKELDSLLLVAKDKLKNVVSVLDKPTLQLEIQDIEFQLGNLSIEREKAIRERSQILIAEHWNASYLDFGIGKINTFLTDNFGTLDSLRLDRNTALGIWTNWGIRAGKYSQVSFLVRGHKYRENVNFQLENLTNGILLDSNTVAGNVVMTYGVNYRFGSPYFTFFAEFLMERKAVGKPVDALNNSFIVPSDFQVIEESVNWNIVQPYTINFGGDWRVKRNIVLNFGIRSVFTNSFKVNTFLPVVGVACLMR
jgi:hypothetical protein